MTLNAETTAAARAWLAEMEDCVRQIDFERCRAIFAPDVVGFGSRADRLVDLEALERDQWRHVWPRIRDFTFLRDQLSLGAVVAGDDGLIWLACPWTSQGRREDGTPFTRPGRMTAVLERRNNRWLAVHTHHSVNPV